MGHLLKMQVQAAACLHVLHSYCVSTLSAAWVFVGQVVVHVVVLQFAVVGCSFVYVCDRLDSRAFAVVRCQGGRLCAAPLGFGVPGLSATNLCEVDPTQGYLQEQTPSPCSTHCFG